MRPHTALLLIDLQRAFLSSAYEAAGLVTRVVRLAAAARAAGAPVIYVRHDGEPDSNVAPGTSGWSIHPDLTPQNGDLVIGKRGADAFEATSLGASLRELDVRRLVVAGYATEYCVDSTTRAALAHGYDVVLVGDGHTTYDRDRSGEFGAVISAEAAIAHHNHVLSTLQQPPGSLTLTRAADVSFPGR
jgi:nicotinamidase-related amidase